MSDKLTPMDLIWAMKRGNWWEDLRFPAAAAGKGANAPTYDTTNLGYVFSDNPPSNQQLQFIAQIPHRWRIGGEVEVHIHWALLDDDGAGGEDVKWDIQYRWNQTGDVIAAFAATIENTIDVSGYLQNELIYTDVGEPTDPGITQPSSIIEILLERDTADAADDHPHDVILKELDLHYEIDSFGSWGELEKWG